MITLLVLLWQHVQAVQKVYRSLTLAVRGEGDSLAQPQRVCSLACPLQHPKGVLFLPQTEMLMGKHHDTLGHPPSTYMDSLVGLFASTAPSVPCFEGSTTGNLRMRV